MQHKIFFNKDKGFIEIDLAGDVSVDDFNILSSEFVRMAEDLKKNNQPVNLLMDYNEVGGISPKVIMMAHAVLKPIQVGKLAGYADNAYSRAIMNTMIILAEAGPMSKQFATREEAEQWLLKKDE